MLSITFVVFVEHTHVCSHYLQLNFLKIKLLTSYWFQLEWTYDSA